MIGARIKQARKAAGLSVRGLAQAVGVSAMAVSKYERDQMKPGSETLLRLGRALDVRTEYFFRLPAVELSALDFRKHASLSAKDEGRVREDVRGQMERWLELEDLLHGSAVLDAFALPDGLPDRIASYDAVELASDALRDAWKLGSGPIRNLIDKMEEEGIRVMVTPHDGGGRFDGLVACANGHTVIVVGSGAPGDRQRFTLAHELGHLVLRGRLAPGLDLEQACNRFAGAFIVPAEEARRVLGTSRSWLEPRELFVLKHEWGLSMNSWLRRAHELGILGASGLRRHQQFFTAQVVDGRSWRECEPGEPYPLEQPCRFHQLVFRALAEDLIGESKAAELLGIQVSELISLRRMDAIDAAGRH
jgi:Zn-dependent peptidase ImmA (M78 family)/DNA-binding XRE family transcriptional regulator